MNKHIHETLKQFITLYKNSPCLWNQKSKEYYDRHKRRDAYKILMAQLKLIDPDADTNAVVRKINSLRSNIRKEYRKVLQHRRTGRVYVPKLWYYPMFNFITGQKRGDNEQSETENTDETKEYEMHIENQDPLKTEFGSTSEGNFDDEEPIEIPVHDMEVQDSTIAETFDSKNDDRHEIFGKNVAMKLRHIESNDRSQRLYAEKIINDALFMAEMGLLTVGHCNLKP